MPTKEQGSEPLLKNKPQIEQPNLIELQVNSVEELISLLNDHNIDYSKWRKNPKKLFEEIEKGETEMVQNKNVLERHTNTVLVEVYSPKRDQKLVEQYQVTYDESDNEIERNIREISGLSEKIKKGQVPIDEVCRAMSEELFGGVDFDQSSISVKQIPLDKNVKTPESAYEGLITVNNLNRFAAILPENLYKPEGYVEVQEIKGGGRKRNFMVWVSLSAVK